MEGEHALNKRRYICSLYGELRVIAVIHWEYICRLGCDLHGADEENGWGGRGGGQERVCNTAGVIVKSPSPLLESASCCVCVCVDAYVLPLSLSLSWAEHRWGSVFSLFLSISLSVSLSLSLSHSGMG